MPNELQLLKRITPEVTFILKRRYDMLNTIQSFQPIGRRLLALKIAVSERITRRELSLLQKEGFVLIGAEGVSLTLEGAEFLNDIQPLLREILGLNRLGEELARRYGLSKALVVPGDSGEDEKVLRDIARAAALVLKERIKGNSVIAVMGGSTLAALTEMFTGMSFPEVTVVPARGGLGERVEIQANTIAAKLATNIGGRYRLLHIPENLDPIALKALLADRRIQEVINTIKKADILVYSVGRADVMARRRGLSFEDMEKLLEKGAVAETLGNYLSDRGEVVERAPGIGLEFNDMSRLALTLMVAGGRHKAEALAAALKGNNARILVTDEGAAREILADLI
ncbi:MAG TPA: sugar-binding transcriptional regulator [Firmicutes bacterium]|nr:sugar-binding transcriptional regulator [Bacillota bacterium]